MFPAVYDKTRLVPSKTTLKADGQDVVVIDIYSPETELEVKVGNAVFLGWGNGDPGFKDVERPAGNAMTIRTFNGCAQVIVRSLASSSSVAASSSIACQSFGLCFFACPVLKKFTDVEWCVQRVINYVSVF